MKPYTKTRPFSLLVASFLKLGVACTPVTDQPSVTIKGSDTMVGLAQRWAEVYMEQNPESKPPGRSAIMSRTVQQMFRTGLDAFVNRGADLAEQVISGRPVTGRHV
jgi:ABC-type phosphate transport system substrate-binding protein